MPKQLKDRRIAILATDGFEQSELIEPRKALSAEGARVDVVAPKSGRIRGWQVDDWATRPPSTWRSARPIPKPTTPWCCRAASSIRPEERRVGKGGVSTCRSR